MTIGTTSPLDAALAYAARGWRVVPIKPGEKYPPMNAWQDTATTDKTLIREWWERWPDHGVGIATGSTSDLFVLDVDVSDGKQGDETLADLEATHGALTPTVEVVTGSGGRHLYFRMPLLDVIRNDAGKRLGPGLDVRGEGGQVLAPPTVHPNGRRYEWEASGDPDTVAVAYPPHWLVALLTAEPNSGARRELVTPPGDRPGDRWAASVSWAELLTGDGATYLSTRTDHASRQPYEMWARPGVDHASGTLYYRGSDVLKVFSSDWRVVDPATGQVTLLEQDATYTKFGYYAATRHGGDHAAAARAIAVETHGDPAELLAAFLADLDTIAPAPVTTDTQPEHNEDVCERLAVRWVDDLATTMPPEPDELVTGLLRAGELCVFGAPRAIGKTWLGYNLSILLDRGEGEFLGRLKVQRRANVLYLQGELDQWGSATRWKMLTDLDQPLPHIAETFDRLRIRTIRRRITSTVDGITFSDEHIDAIVDGRLETVITELGVDVVVIDPWAVYFAGAENSNDEAEAALDKLRDITLRHGTAWVILHHIGKSSDYREPEDLWRGASRLADWASTRVTILPHYTEARRKELGKDRHDARRFADAFFLRRSTPTDDFSMELNGGWWQAWEPPDDEAGTGRPPAVATYEVVTALRENGGIWPSFAAAAAALDVDDKTAKRAIKRAQESGHVKTQPGPRGSTLTTLAPPDDDPDDLGTTTSEHDLGTTVSPRSKTPSDQEF